MSPKKQEKLRKFNRKWESEAWSQGWLVDATNDNSFHDAYCKVCKIHIRAHKTDLKKHSESTMHKTNMRQASIPQGQSKLTDSNIVIITDKEKEKEMLFAIHTAIHSSIRSVDHLGDLINRVRKESISISLHRTKCSMIIKNVIAPCLLESLLVELKDRSYSLIIDESTDISTVKYLCVCVRYFSVKSNEIVVQFLGLVEIEKATAVELYKALTEFLKSLNLNIKNMIGLGTDGASNLCGVNSSLFTLLKKENTKLQLVRCICHSIDNASSKAAEALPSNLDFLCREIFSWFSHSSLRQIEYRRLFDILNKGDKVFHSFVQLSQTRWLCRFNVINIILEHYEELQTHFSVVVNKEKCYSARIINEMLQDKCNYLYFLILRPILHEVNKVNCLFQSTNAEIGEAVDEIKRLILFLGKKIFKPVFANFDDICNNINNELAFLHPSKVDYGIDYQREVRICKVSVKEVENLELRATGYIKKLVGELLLRLPNNIKHFESLQCLSPKICLNQVVRKKFSELPFLDDFADSKILFKMESQYNSLVDVNWLSLYGEEVVSDSYKFWPTVLKHNGFKAIAMFVLTVLSLPVSNAVVERVFSIMNSTKTKIRNRMQTPMLNSILTIKSHLLVNKICCKDFECTKAMHMKFNNNMYKYKSNIENTDGDDLIEIADDNYDAPCIEIT